MRKHIGFALALSAGLLASGSALADVVVSAGFAPAYGYYAPAPAYYPPVYYPRRVYYPAPAPLVVAPTYTYAYPRPVIAVGAPYFGMRYGWGHPGWGRPGWGWHR